MKKIDDILTQLQHQQPDVSNPDELTDRLMDCLPDLDAQPANDEPGRRSARRARLYIFSAIAVAASVLLFLMLNINQDMKEEKRTAQNEIVLTAREPTPNPAETNSAPDRNTPRTYTISSRVLTGKTMANQARQTDRNIVVKHKASHLQSFKHERVSSTADSLDYYIAKIERELTQVDESLYIERMQKLIHADERLQRIVNNYLLHQLDKDGRPIEAINTNNVNTTENEE